MTRQNIKQKDYFINYLTMYKSHIQRGFEMLSNGKVMPDRVNWFKKGQFNFILNYAIANYTLGKPIEDVKTEFLKVIEYVDKVWISDIVLLNFNGKTYKQYSLSNYDEMLWMLSLGYLLNINDNDFKKLVDLIDRDGVVDYLFEFIINSKIKDRKQLDFESYQEFFGIQNAFEKLRLSIFQTDKVKAENLIQEFITKDWYKNHKEVGWYNSHKSKHDTYFGYWSFETAAVVKIMGLDDNSFRDCKYYPKDLVKKI